MTSDAGLWLPRELDKRLGLDALIERHLTDPRSGPNRQFPLPDLFRRSIYSRLAGYEDTNDTERLAEDPAFRMLASRERRETSVALTSTLHWFETDVLTEERNYQGLARLNTALIQRAARPILDPAGDARHRQLREPGPRGACMVRPRSASVLSSNGRTQFCTHVSGLSVELCELRAMMRIRAGPSFITSPASCCGRAVVQVSDPPVDCVAIILQSRRRCWVGDGRWPLR